MIVDMNEFLLWSNCTNNCKFCWQHKISDYRCILNEDEKIRSLNKVMEKIKELPESDVLLVGGEICNASSDKVKQKFFECFTEIFDRVIKNKIRFFYINTNLLFKDLSIIEFLCKLFKDIPDRLKFTTSYDISGRFNNIEDKNLFLTNLKFITKTFPSINIVVNTILTKQVCESNFSVKGFCEEYGVRLVNLIPYIPIKYGDELTPSYGEMISILRSTDKEIPGYFESYIKNFDIPQEKKLFEYHKDIDDFEECTADYSKCGHNKNFQRILKNGECFVCKLKEDFELFSR